MSGEAPPLLLEGVETSSEGEIKRILEALLFASGRPVPLAKLREVIATAYPITPRRLRQLLEALDEEYRATNRAFFLAEVADGYLLRTHPTFALYIQQLLRTRRGEKLSPAATEVLAIIAYRQPITRSQIEAIRGVDSSATLQNLLERELIAAAGKAETPGRPTLYATSEKFLEHYGLKELPTPM